MAFADPRAGPSDTSPPPRLRWLDLAPALLLLVIGMSYTGIAGRGQEEWVRAPDVLAYGMVAGAALALLLRRIAPLVTLVLCGLAVSLYLILDYPPGPILLVGPVAAYAVAVRLPWRTATAWCAGFAGVTSASLAPRFVEQKAQWWLLAWLGLWTGALAAAAAIGALTQVRRRSQAEIRAELARRAVSEERLAMAQDVHDGVGHGLAVVALQAGVALHLLDREPERARELLTSILATSRESLTDLRADLDVLRVSKSLDTTGMPARRPAPGLDELPMLLARMRRGGLVLHEDVEPLSAIPPELDAAAFRIVQEALTNVLRHAGGATPVWIRVAQRGNALVVEVRDAGAGTLSLGRGPARAAGGTGIPGMQRRAAALGGRLHAGPVPEGGFVVQAELPLRATTPTGTVAS